MKRIAFAIAVLAIAVAGRAEAGSTTFGYTAGTGTTFAAPTNGSGQLGAPFGTVCDGTALANCAAVKPASTAPVAADPAIVVDLSPNCTVCGSATGSAVPSTANYVAAVSSGNLTGIIQPDNSAPINVSTATTTQLVALSSGKKIYVSAMDFVNASGTADNVTFEYGTGSNCGTGTTALTGPYATGTNSPGLSKGGGLGVIMTVPASNALCMVTSAAVQVSGSVSYTQF